jgi:hypothetical protein
MLNIDRIGVVLHSWSNKPLLTLVMPWSSELDLPESPQPLNLPLWAER